MDITDQENYMLNFNNSILCPDENDIFKLMDLNVLKNENKEENKEENKDENKL